MMILVSCNMLQGEVWMVGEVLAYGLEYIPAGTECFVGECRTFSICDLVDRVDDSKIVTPKRCWREGMMEISG